MQEIIYTHEIIKTHCRIVKTMAVKKDLWENRGKSDMAYLRHNGGDVRARFQRDNIDKKDRLALLERM